MQSRYKVSANLKHSRVNAGFWTPTRIIFATVYGILFLVSGAYTISFVASFISQSTTVFPTSLPWIESEYECNYTNKNHHSRVWLDGKCWDYEHGKDF